MKTRMAGSTGRDGSVLMVTLFSAVLIGTVLASYLTLVRHQDVAVARSQGWNAALAMAEGGVEEALAQMNSGATNFSFDFSANGWGPPSGGNFKLQSRTMTSGHYAVRFFTNSASPNPTIYSTGYVTMPALSATVERKIMVATRAVPLINVALAAKYGITMSGSGFLSDSFDSADLTHSDNGHYPGNSSKRLKNGDVASVYGPVNLGGSPNIKGDLYLGPTVAIPAGPVSGKIYSDFNADYPDVAAPANAASWPPAKITGSGSSATYYFDGSSDDYTLNDSTTKIVVRPWATVRLYVTTPTFSPSEIQIQTDSSGSGTLTIYQVSGSASFVGNNAIIVGSGRAENFWYYGMSGVTSVTYNRYGNPFFGVIYAPSANLTLNGGGSGVYLVGACVAKTITMDAHYDFHFDEHLLEVVDRPIRGYVASAWEEL